MAVRPSSWLLVLWLLVLRFGDQGRSSEIQFQVCRTLNHAILEHAVRARTCTAHTGIGVDDRCSQLLFNDYLTISDHD
jgi:hypothetical protein